MRLYSPPKAEGALPPQSTPLANPHLRLDSTPSTLSIIPSGIFCSGGPGAFGGGAEGEWGAGTGARQAGSSSRLLREGTRSLAPSLRPQVPLKGGSVTTRGSPSSSRGPHRGCPPSTGALGREPTRPPGTQAAASPTHQPLRALPSPAPPSTCQRDGCGAGRGKGTSWP